MLNPDTVVVQQALLLALGRHASLVETLAKFGTLEAFAAHLASPEGEARLSAIVTRLQQEDVAVLDEPLAAFTLDVLMELDVLERLKRLEASVFDESDLE